MRIGLHCAVGEVRADKTAAVPLEVGKGQRDTSLGGESRLIKVRATQTVAQAHQQQWLMTARPPGRGSDLCQANNIPSASRIQYIEYPPI